MPRTADPKKGRAPKAHKLAEEFPKDLELIDLYKKKWQLGNVIGQGGFGLIYLASECDASTSVDPQKAEYVIKIEPKNNGPLYCEMQFYQRAAKQTSIQSFASTHHLRYLGIPPFIATGSHTYKSQEYRFLVMPRLGTDLQKMLVESGGKFAANTTFAVGLRILDALQYLHDNEYVHADIKAANILLGYVKGTLVTNEVYLVDYGLAYRYTVDGKHKEYKEDPRRAHEGTIEFTSRDAHKGLAPARRGDMEILGFCLLQWLCGRLPWEDNLTNPSKVAESKFAYMADVSKLISKCLPGPRTFISDCMEKYFEAVKSLNYDSKPDYKRFKDILKTGLTKSGQKDEWKIEFSPSVKAKKRKSTDLESSLSSPKARKGKSPATPAKKRKSSDSESSFSSPQAKSRKAPASKAAKSKAGGVKSPLSRATLQKATKTAKPKGKPDKSKAAVVSSILGKAKTTKASPVKSKSPRVSPAKSKPVLKTPMTNGRRPQKRFPMPAPTKPTASKSPAASNGTNKRKVKRVAAVQSDASIQTSPGLLSNR